MSSITELSERIVRNSAIVEKWLTGKNAKVSFDQDAEDEFPDTDGEPEIEAARMAVIDDTSALHDLFLGPREVLARVWGAVSNIENCMEHDMLKCMSRPLTMRLNNVSITSKFFLQFH